MTAFHAQVSVCAVYGNDDVHGSIIQIKLKKKLLHVCFKKTLLRHHAA